MLKIASTCDKIYMIKTTLVAKGVYMKVILLKDMKGTGKKAISSKSTTDTHAISL